MTPEPRNPEIRDSPLFPLVYRNILRLLRRAPDNVKLGDGALSERVRALMARQITRRVGIEGSDVEGTRGYAAACEGHNASVAKNRQQYAELCALDTVEQIYRMLNLSPSLSGMDDDIAGLEDTDFNEAGLPGFSRTAIEQRERRYPVPQRAPQRPSIKSGLDAMASRSKRRPRNNRSS